MVGADAASGSSKDEVLTATGCPWCSSKLLESRKKIHTWHESPFRNLIITLERPVIGGGRHEVLLAGRVESSSNQFESGTVSVE